MLAVAYSDDRVAYEPVFRRSIPQYLQEVSNDYIITHNGKYDRILLKRYALDFKIGFDTMLAQYLLHPDREIKLEKVYEQITGEHKEDLVEVYNRVTGKKVKNLPEDWHEEIPLDQLETYTKADITATKTIFQVLEAEIDASPIKDVFYSVEIPFLNILTETEILGVKLDIPQLTKLRDALQIDQTRLDQELKILAEDENLNVNSTKQLQNLLFVKFRLDKIKKTKTGYSTDSKTLEKLKHHPFVAKLLEFREVSKILSTYTDSLISQVDINDRIHTNYNICFTETNRLSSDHPNLQNIPVKGKYGQKIRNCFIADTEKVFLIVDFDQIELRLLAHFTQDPNLKQWFAENKDIHQGTADMIAARLGKTFTRQQGKILNFSLMYGKTEWGFSKDWNVSVEEAKKIIDIYYEQFPSVKAWKDQQEFQMVEQRGWCKSIANIPLYVGDPMMAEPKDYAHMLRCAVNYPIQSSSQDLMKYGVVALHQKYGIIPLLLVHDELVYELPNDKNVMQLKNQIVKTIEEETRKRFGLAVPVKVSHKLSSAWQK